MIKGQKHSLESKKRISESKRAQHIIPKSAFKKDYIPWNKGRKCDWVSERNLKNNPSKSKEGHWNWRGGVSRVYKTGYYSAEYKKWRKSVFERDNYTCQDCGNNGYVEVHHIKSFAHYPELRFDVNNGLVLCKKCHKKTDNYGIKNRKKVKNLV